MSTLLLLLLAACGGKTTDTGTPCVPLRIVATDIDETLTTADEEFLAQIFDPTYDPVLHPDANTLMQAYADRGYTVLYITARWAGITLLDGRTATQATADWLLAHDFPYAPENLYLSEELLIGDDPTIDYKARVLTDRAAAGWTMDWAYGNATTDIDAFQDAGFGNDHIFLVGELAGTEEVGAISDADAYTAHMTAQIQVVPDATCGP